MNNQLNNFTVQIRLIVCAALLGGLALSQRVQAQGFVVANAASYGAQGDTKALPTPPVQVDAYRRTLAPDLITAAFGTFVTLNGQTYVANTVPLPTTLGGVRLQVNGVDAPLFFVAPGQINFAVPPNLVDTTTVTLRVFNSNNTQATGTCNNGPCIITRSSPGIFSIKATGDGAAAALTTFDGITYTPVFNTDLSPANVDAGTTARPNVLVLYGTGIRRIPAANPNDANGVAEALSVTLQGVPLNVAYAGPAPGFVGLDQVNVILPPEMAGLGICKLALQAIPSLNPAFFSNAVDLKMGGSLPPIRVNGGNLNFDQTVNGELTASDQVQLLNDGSGRAYFFDVYTFTTTQPNQPVAIDMRRDNAGGNQLDSAVLLYRITANSNLEQVGQDDQSGSYGNGRVESTNNALLLMVLPQAGNYAIFASSADIQPAPLGVGKYALRLYSPQMRQLTYGQNLPSETIVASDIRTSADTLFDVFYFNASANENIDIRMNSAAFASYFVLQQNGLSPVVPPNSNCGTGASCGDAGVAGREARLQWRIGETATYLILATPYEPNRTGAYSISLVRTSALESEQPASQGVIAAPARGVGSSRLNGRAVTRVIEE